MPAMSEWLYQRENQVLVCVCVYHHHLIQQNSTKSFWTKFIYYIYQVDVFFLFYYRDDTEKLSYYVWFCVFVCVPICVTRTQYHDFPRHVFGHGEGNATFWTKNSLNGHLSTLRYTKGTLTPSLKLLLKNYCIQIFLFGPTCYNLRFSS